MPRKTMRKTLTPNLMMAVVVGPAVPWELVADQPLMAVRVVLYDDLRKQDGIELPWCTTRDLGQ